ncbi:MAG TPA: gliding motility-associated C-terminal domain-containing protein [Cytophagaceae bacterium]|nr:gliding motility-associated C-terminal domain-containing protein [Cytophagaceae bacterium]
MQIKAQTASCDGSGMISIAAATVSKPTCEGRSDGSISLAVSGPAGASYTYTLTGAASNPPPPAVTSSNSYNFSNLEAIGFYVLEVRTPVDPSDPNTNYYSCVQILNMAPVPAMQVSVSSNPPACASGSDATADLTITNGTAPYQVSWSDGGSGMSHTGLSQGNYTASVTDAHGCTGSASVTITDPPPISVTATTTGVTCNGDQDGSVSFSASNGTEPYTYSSSTGGAGNSVSDLSPGTYSVTVTDANSCTITSSYTITEPPVLSASTDPIPPLKCNGDQNANVTITGTGGTAPYSYTMDATGDQQSGASVSFGGNGAGDGSITVTDANGCKASVSFSVSGPPPVDFELSMKKDNCSEGSGYIKSLSPASGGNGGPYTYEYSANGSAFQSFTPPQDFAASDGITTAGENVSVNITDKDGCVSTFGSTIENLPRAVPYIRIERNPCLGKHAGAVFVDSVKKNASVPAYTFYFAPDDGKGNFVSQAGSGLHGESALFENLSTGGYLMQIEDGKPCGPYAVSEFYLWNGNGYELVSAGSLYALDDGTGVDSVSSSSSTSGPYAVMHVINPDSFAVSVVSNSSDLHGATGTIWVYDLRGGTPKILDGKSSYQLAIDNPDHLHYYIPKDTVIDDSIHNYVAFGHYPPGMHRLYIRDALGCMDTVMVMITGSFFIPNLITPNGDGSNDVFEVVSIPRYSVLRIFNRWGDRVYYNTDYNNSFSGESLSDGVYYYELELRSGQRFKGWVEVLR